MKEAIKKYMAIFESCGEEMSGDTFLGEFNYASGKLFYLFFATLFVWLPYIPYDLRLHQFPAFAVAIRIAFSLVSAAMIALKLSKPFRNRPVPLVATLITALYTLTALITGTSGEHATSYMSGFILVLLLPVFVTFPVKLKYPLPALSVGLFLLSGALTGLDFSSFAIRYSLNDVIVAMLLGFLLAYLLNKSWYLAWEQRRELKQALETNEKNLATIYQLAEKAEASDRAKTNFLAAMSHDIRTPMNAILGIAQMQMQEGGLPKGQADALEKIFSSGNSLMGIINDILDMSKIDSGDLELNPTEYDMPSMINDAVQLNVIRIGQKPIDFELDIDENLPARLFGDVARLKQILNSLLSNAIKYTEKGRVRLSIDHTAEGEDVALRFVVEDTGQGIKPEGRERLFSEYTFIDAESNAAIESTGLGLIYTKRLVELMGGEIGVESEYRKGSTFTVTVMQKAVGSGPIGADLAQQLSGFTFREDKLQDNMLMAPAPMPYGRILVVDDVAINLYVAKGLLQTYDLDIETADSGFEALDRVNCGSCYDIIFMDHMMPQMDGIETTQKLREMGYTGTIVALTANALMGNDEMFRQNGFDDFLAKPIDVQLLDEMLHRYVRVARLEGSDGQDGEYAGQTGDSAVGLAGAPSGARGPDARERRLPVAEINPELLEIFLHDAEKTIGLLRETMEDGDMKLFSTTAHGMKSALMYVGETAASEMAGALEAAGKNDDMDYIAANTGGFVHTLEALIRRLGPSAADEGEADDVAEDTAFLSEELQAFRAACEGYNDALAFAILDRLRGRLWKRGTAAALKEIHNDLYLHSDFELAGEKAAEMLLRAAQPLGSHLQ